MMTQIDLPRIVRFGGMSGNLWTDPPPVEAQAGRHTVDCEHRHVEVSTGTVKWPAGPNPRIAGINRITRRQERICDESHPSEHLGGKPVGPRRYRQPSPLGEPAEGKETGSLGDPSLLRVREPSEDRSEDWQCLATPMGHLQEPRVLETRLRRGRH